MGKKENTPQKRRRGAQKTPNKKAERNAKQTMDTPQQQQQQQQKKRTSTAPVDKLSVESQRAEALQFALRAAEAIEASRNPQAQRKREKRTPAKKTQQRDTDPDVNPNPMKMPDFSSPASSEDEAMDSGTHEDHAEVSAVVDEPPESESESDVESATDSPSAADSQSDVESGSLVSAGTSISALLAGSEAVEVASVVTSNALLAILGSNAGSSRKRTGERGVEKSAASAHAVEESNSRDNDVLHYLAKQRAERAAAHKALRSESESQREARENAKAKAKSAKDQLKRDEPRTLFVGNVPLTAKAQVCLRSLVCACVHVCVCVCVVCHYVVVLCACSMKILVKHRKYE
jgi:hypothetical protein